MNENVIYLENINEIHFKIFKGVANILYCISEYKYCIISRFYEIELGLKFTF